MSDNSDLLEAVGSLSRQRVLVIGDVMLDRFVYGDVERISPEAPIPVLRVERENKVLGGAGNVLRNLRALGLEADLLGIVGDDTAGAEVQQLVAETGAVDRLQVEAGRRTTVKERFLAAGQQLLRSDREQVEAVNESSAEALSRSLADAFAQEVPPGAIVMSDYGKGVLQPALRNDVIRQARESGCPLVVDPKGRDFSIYGGAQLVTPNRRELSEASGLSTDSDSEVEAACRQIIETAAVEGVLATRSERGMTLVGAVGVHHLPAQAQEVFDVSGAGDTVVAVVAAALAAGLTALDAARLANVAAGLVVAKRGTAVVASDELLRALHTVDLLAAERKVADLDHLTVDCTDWRRAGLRIGFTNGCFDLLHPGHVSLLQQARAACDRLIVGLNSDTSVRRLKGEGRPVQGEAARAAVLASLATVDRVVLFSEDTPLRLIESLRPDVLVKGADYRLDQVVGGDVVRGYGGRVLLAELSPGHSTTATLARLAESGGL